MHVKRKMFLDRGRNHWGLLKQIGHVQSVGPDGMHPRMLRGLINVIILLSQSSLKHCGDWGGSW